MMKMSSYRSQRYTAWISIAWIGGLLGLLAVLGKNLNAESSPVLDAVVAAHGVKLSSPQTVQMTGVVDRGGRSDSFRLLATGDEQLRIEYGTSGNDTLVMSKKLVFHDDGVKFAYQKTPPGFAQLDITGLFLIEQLRNRTIRVDSTMDQVVVANAPAQRFRVQNDRSEMHLGSIRVTDSVDIYLDKSGVLAGISRVFYEGHPETYTQAFAFSDYRNTDGLLLPYQIDVFIKSQRRQTFRIDKYQFDVPIDGNLFLGRRVQ